MVLSAEDAFLIQWTRGFAADLARVNPILRVGQPGYERDTGRFKIGDGSTPWNDLPYYLSESEIGDLVRSIVADNGSVSGSAWQAALQQHIDNGLPHPVYDDGPSLALIYENAKV